ncbi:MAG: toast rack family protein [Candidatus Acidiferrales bacterium]
MDGTGIRRRRSPTGGVILIVIGVFFLLVTLRPEFNPWPILAHYWPVILIVIGLGKIWDAVVYQRSSADAASDALRGRRDSGAWMALVILLVLFSLALWKGRTENYMRHETHSVERQGAKAVSASIEIPAGTLKLSAGATKLLDADFLFRKSEGEPRVDYNVSGDHGDLSITGEEKHLHIGTTHNTWDLRFASDVPLDLNVRMGAGQSDLHLNDLNVTHLAVNIGAGEMQLDLTGERKANLDAQVEGGVGSASIYLPKDVGVKVHATGGVGAISARELTKDGDDYINSSYGKTPATITLDIHGGVGAIVLVQR